MDAGDLLTQLAQEIGADLGDPSRALSDGFAGNGWGPEWGFAPDCSPSQWEAGYNPWDGNYNPFAPDPSLDSLLDDTGGGRRSPTTEAKTERLTPALNGVNITFDPGADNLVTMTLADTFDQIMISNPQLSSVNISSTSEITKSHLEGSNHVVGDAVDINYINGVHVLRTGEGLILGGVMELTAMQNPNTQYVEGPAGNFYRDTPTSSWRVSKDLDSMYTHVHFDVFPAH